MSCGNLDFEPETCLTYLVVIIYCATQVLMRHVAVRQYAVSYSHTDFSIAVKLQFVTSFVCFVVKHILFAPWLCQLMSAAAFSKESVIQLYAHLPLVVPH